MEFKKSAAYTKEQEDSKQKTKRTILQMLKSKLLLIVDKLNRRAGTTNTGNLARSFFAHPDGIGTVTGLQ